MRAACFHCVSTGVINDYLLKLRAQSAVGASQGRWEGLWSAIQAWRWPGLIHLLERDRSSAGDWCINARGHAQDYWMEWKNKQRVPWLFLLIKWRHCKSNFWGAKSHIECVRRLFRHWLPWQPGGPCEMCRCKIYFQLKGNFRIATLINYIKMAEITDKNHNEVVAWFKNKLWKLLIY